MAYTPQNSDLISQNNEDSFCVLYLQWLPEDFFRFIGFSPCKVFKPLADKLWTCLFQNKKLVPVAGNLPYLVRVKCKKIFDWNQAEIPEIFSQSKPCSQKQDVCAHVDKFLHHWTWKWLRITNLAGRNLRFFWQIVRRHCVEHFCHF